MGSLHLLNDFKARRLVEDGRFYVSEGDLDRAIETFQTSLEWGETAEALTYLGWVLNLKGQTDEAMELCRRAIKVDPEFGAAYNDLGSYLIKRDQLEEAIPFLEKAVKAPRYDAPHFPHMNLGRVYAALGRIDDAIAEFRNALEFVPGHQEIQNVLDQLIILKNS